MVRDLLYNLKDRFNGLPNDLRMGQTRQSTEGLIGMNNRKRWCRHDNEPERKIIRRWKGEKDGFRMQKEEIKIGVSVNRSFNQ